MANATKGRAGTDETAAAAQLGKPKRAPSKRALVKQVLERIASKLEKDELKPTVGDFVRLVQLEKELHQERLEETPKEIKVSWVEPE